MAACVPLLASQHVPTSALALFRSLWHRLAPRCTGQDGAQRCQMYVGTIAWPYPVVVNNAPVRLQTPPSEPMDEVTSTARTRQKMPAEAGAVTTAAAVAATAAARPCSKQPPLPSACCPRSTRKWTARLQLGPRTTGLPTLQPHARPHARLCCLLQRQVPQ